MLRTASLGCRAAPVGCRVAPVGCRSPFGARRSGFSPRTARRRGLHCCERAAAAADAVELPPCEEDSKGVERLVLQEEGWQRWEWRGYSCNYISAGASNDGPIVVLVHGFGAHSFHWRYTVPALARKGCRVYALCMLGYGWSPKADEKYCMELWGQQVIDFTQQVAGATAADKAVIAGNSIGALAALYAASREQAVCKGLCLINAAGNFEPGAPPGPERKTASQQAMGIVDDVDDPTVAQRLKELFGRAVAAGIFYFTKIRIKQILQQVYVYEVDAPLVESINMAAEDAGALNAFYQISLAGGRTRARPRDLLRAFDGPVMLLWGSEDPWMTPTKAERIMELKSDALYTPVLAGHCPHDDAPEEANCALAEWAASLPP